MKKRTSDLNFLWYQCLKDILIQKDIS